MIPQLFYVPSSEATEDQILLRMHHLAEEHDMTVIFVSKIDENDFRITKQKVEPKPKSLFLKSGGVRVPKYMHVYIDKDPKNAYKTPNVSIKGHFFNLPNRLLGKTHHFGILIDESKP